MFWGCPCIYTLWSITGVGIASQWVIRGSFWGGPQVMVQMKSSELGGDEPGMGPMTLQGVVVSTSWEKRTLWQRPEGHLPCCALDNFALLPFPGLEAPNPMWSPSRGMVRKPGHWRTRTWTWPRHMRPSPEPINSWCSERPLRRSSLFTTRQFTREKNPKRVGSVRGPQNYTPEESLQVH